MICSYCKCFWGLTSYIQFKFCNCVTITLSNPECFLQCWSFDLKANTFMISGSNFLSADLRYRTQILTHSVACFCRFTALIHFFPSVYQQSGFLLGYTDIILTCTEFIPNQNFAAYVNITYIPRIIPFPLTDDVTMVTRRYTAMTEEITLCTGV